MIKKIKELLQGVEYKMWEDETNIQLFREEYPGYYPEDYIGVDITDRYIVYEGHRDNKYVVLETKDPEEAALYTVILFHRLWVYEGDYTTAGSVGEYVDNGQVEKALDLIKRDIDDSYISMHYEEPSKISFLQRGAEVDIKYDGRYIVERRSLSHGYAILYNYARELQYITTYFDEIKDEISISVNREDICRLYIFMDLKYIIRSE